MNILSEIKKTNKTFHPLRIQLDGCLERIGISQHFVQRLEERFWGLSITQLERLLNSGGTFQYNPSKDELPDNITKECVISICDKHIKYGKECRFYLIPSEDMVVIIGYRDWIGEGEKPIHWNNWVLMTIWKVSTGILQEEVKSRDSIKVGGRIIYLK